MYGYIYPAYGYPVYGGVIIPMMGLAEVGFGEL